MATNWIARRSREQPIGTEAEPGSGARQTSSANANSLASYSDQCEKGDGERRNSGRVRDPTVSSRPRSQGRAEEKPSSRSGTAGRFSRSKSRSRREGCESRLRLGRSRSRGPSKVEEAAKDLADRPPPQLTRLDCTNVYGDASTIGVAVGSPSQWQPTNPGPLVQSPLSKMEIEAPNANDQYWQDATNKSRNPRWKKIGDLFKAKAAFSEEPSPSPFYQLQAQYAAQMANQSQSSLHSHSIQPDSGASDARFLFDKILAPNGQLGRQNHMGTPLPHLHGAQRQEEDTSRPSGHTSSQQRPMQPDMSSVLPLLDVQIPDVQMERYSVMFGNLLTQQESPGLLSRRDKTLKNLFTISDEDDGAAAVVQVHERLPDKSETSNKEAHSRLTPDAHHAYPRRATSPTPSKSPSFSLFPQLPQAPEKIVGPIPPGKQSELQRSFTAPARLSPMQERFSLEQVQAPKVDDVGIGHQMVWSPQTASTSDPRRESSSHSVRSPTSTRSSVIEDVLLNLGPLDPLARKQDQSELMKDGELKVAPLKFKHDGSNVQSPPLTSEEVGSGFETANRVNIHEDTLAALERPRSVPSKSKDVASSLKPSKARIDQIMRGASPNPISESPAQVKYGNGLPEEPQRKVASETPPKAENPPAPRTGAEIETVELPTLAASASTVPAKGHKPRMASREQEKVPVSSHTRARKEVEVQDAQPLMNSQQQPLQGPDALDSPERRPTNATQLLPGHTHDASVPRIRQPPRQPQPIKGQAPQFINGQAQLRPPVANTSHRLHPRANPPQTTRPAFHPNNRFPTYRPPPVSFRMPQPAHYQANQQQRPNVATTPPAEKEQDILDYYLEESVTNPPPPPPKSPKKLQKRFSEKPKNRFSVSKKWLPEVQGQEQAHPQPHPQPQPQPQSQMQPKPIQPIEKAPRSPVPVSKFSPNATVQSSVISPAIVALRRHDHSHSYSSTLSEQDPLDPHLLSPAVRAAREKAAKIIKASSVEDLGLAVPPGGGGGPSTSNAGQSPPPPRSSSRAECTLTVDAPNKTLSSPPNQTSFYSHSDTSSPSLELPPPTKVLGSHHHHLFSEPQQHQQQQQQASKTPVSKLKHHPSKGASLSSLPPGAGSRSNSPPTKPPQPIRSASAGTVGSGSGSGVGSAAAPGLLCHLKPGKGEKVVEVQAGLVPRIVEQSCGHRAGRSVNLVIESV
jgi:hypothetical protein